MIIGAPREIAPGESRIAITPDSAKKLIGLGLDVHVEVAGEHRPAFEDAAYEKAGVKLVGSATELYGAADLIAKVQATDSREVGMMREGSTLLCILNPYANLEIVRALADRGVTTFAMDLMPRITRGQSMDVLSSMSTITGYRAVLLAALALPKLMPMMMTAAGTLKPARVLVLGAGVAGLQAIATARRLGAVVEAFDIRAAVKEQVESLGARFVAQEAIGGDAEDKGGYAREQTEEQQAKQREVLSKHIADSDVVICTALVPGRRAPILLTTEQVQRMSPGSLVIDLAAEQGGNCELTEAGEIVDSNGVQVHGPVNVASDTPVHASQMLGRNFQNYLTHLVEEGQLKLDLEDELTSGPLVTRGGKVVHDGVRAALEA